MTSKQLLHLFRLSQLRTFLALSSFTLLFMLASSGDAKAQYNAFDWGTYIDDDLDALTGFTDEELVDGIAVDTHSTLEAIYVVGRSKSFGVYTDTLCDSNTLSYGAADAFLAKYSVDSSGSCGNIEWMRKLGNPNGSDYGYCIALDYDSASGKTYIYIGGDTKLLTNQDSIYGAFACSYDGCPDDVFQKERRDEWEGFIAKYDDQGELLRWTLLGGNRNNTQAALDQVLSLAVDPVSHDVLITGFTESLNIGKGAINTYDNKYNNKGDGYFAVMDPCLSTLKFFTYYDINTSDTLIPKGQDRCHSILIDNQRDVFLSGTTESLDGIATPNSCLPKYKGGTDAFLGKWSFSEDTNGVISYTPVWGSYIGGKSSDRGRGIALDDEGNVFITGWTSSITFPVSNLAFQKTKGGLIDAFITKFDTVGNCSWSTFYGGIGDEMDNGILWYKNPNDPEDKSVLIIGLTNSNNLPMKDAIVPYLNGNSSGSNTKLDAFVAAIKDVSNSTDTQTLKFATYLGGSKEETNQQALSYGPTIAFGAHYELYFTISTKSENVGMISSAEKIVVGYHPSNPVNIEAFFGKLINTNDTLMTNCDSFPTRIFQEQQEVKRIGQVRYFPNPVTDQLSIQINSELDGDAQLQVLDLYGRLLQTKQFEMMTGSNDVKLDFSSYVPGMYLVKIRLEEQEYSLRVVKQ